LQLVLSWPVRLLVIGLLIWSIFVDGAGLWYRVVNHYPLNPSTPVAGLPPTFNGWQLYIHKGLDLSGGTDLVYQMQNMPPGQNPSDVQKRTIDVIQKRVNTLGVSDPQITPKGNDQIEVQLAGVPAAKAQSVIGTTAQLVTTKWVADPSVTGGPYPGYKPQITNLRSDMLSSADASLDQQGGQGWTVNLNFNSEGGSIFGQLTTQAYNACPQQDCPQRHITEWLDLTPQDVQNWNQNWQNLYKPYSQGGKLLTDPTINQPITGGQAQITGNFDSNSAKNLATLLNSGSLPVTLKPIQSTDVGATLGQDSIKQSLLAGVLGLIIVIIFMIVLYRLPGLLASIALVCYAGLLLMVFKVFNVTVSLAGLTGFVLTVGMAVDANVLIFERFKEEMRAGRTISAAVDSAVRRAWPAIRDSNTATLITSLVLIFLGTGQVKGFAVVLALGVLASLISSIIITHNLLAIVLNFGWVRSGSMLGVQRGRSIS
jgi:preprotein translocase subunit SecD